MLKVPSQITKVQTLADKTLKLDVHVSRELTPENELEVMRLRQTEGWFVFSDTEIKEEDIPTDPIFGDVKSPSQRLRGVLYILWESQPRDMNFDDFYRNTLERLIEHYKQKIDELS